YGKESERGETRQSDTRERPSRLMSTEGFRRIVRRFVDGGRFATLTPRVYERGLFTYRSDTLTYTVTKTFHSIYTIGKRFMNSFQATSLARREDSNLGS